MKISVIRSLPSKILALFIGVSLLLALTSTLVTFWTARRVARYHEQQIAEFVGPHLANKLIASGQTPLGLRSVFSELADISPSLEPYVVNDSGMIVASPFPQLQGMRLPMQLVHDATPPILEGKVHCGPDPNARQGCLSFSLTSLGNGLSLYLVTRGGLSEFFATRAAVESFLIRTWPKILTAFLVLSLIILLVARHFTDGLRQIAQAVSRYKRGDFTQPSSLDPADELFSLDSSIATAAREMKQAEGALALSISQRQQRFFSLAHDLRRPVTAFKLLSERVLTQPLDGQETWRDDLNAVLRQESEFLASLKLLIESSNSSRTETFCLKEIVHQAVSSMKPHADARRLRVTCQTESDIGKLEGDPKALFRAIMNLLDNAIRYSHESGVIDISLENIGGLALLQIRDQGIGIPSRALPHVFDYCFRGRNAQSHAVDGSGIGLATAHSIITGQRGKIWIESAEGEGTSVQCLFPTTENGRMPDASTDVPEGAATLEVMPRPERDRQWPVLELAPSILGLFLVGFFFKEGNSVQAWIWWIVVALSSILTCVAVLRRATRKLPFLYSTSALAWWFSQTFISDGSVETKVFLYFGCQGLLLGLALYPKRETHGLRSLRIILCLQTVLLFLREIFPLEIAFFALGLIWGFLLSQQTNKTFRSLGRRTAAILFIINFGIASIPVFAFSTDYRGNFFAKSSLAQPARSLPHILERIKLLPASDRYEPFLIELGLLNPRISWKVTDLSTKKIHASSLDTRSSELDGSLFEEGMLATIFGNGGFHTIVQNGRRIFAGVIPSSRNDPAFLLTGLEESEFSEAILRRSSQEALIWHAMLVFVLTYGFTLFAVRVAVAAVDRMTRRVLDAVQGSDLSGPWPSGELGDLLRSVQEFVSSTIRSRHQLSCVDRQSTEAIIFLYETLNAHHTSLTEKLMSDQSTVSSTSLLKELENLNEIQGSLLKEFMDYSSLLSVSSVELEEWSLRDLIEDAFLVLASRYENLSVDYREVQDSRLPLHPDLFRIAIEGVFGCWLPVSTDAPIRVRVRSAELSDVHELSMDIRFDFGTGPWGHTRPLEKLKAERIGELHHGMLESSRNPDGVSVVWRLNQRIQRASFENGFSMPRH